MFQTLIMIFYMHEMCKGYLSNILDLFSIIAIFAGILVIINKNPIISLLCLIGLFATISIYLNLIGLNFIGLSYLIVYIGAVSILFLFILMLINLRISELQSNTTNSLPLTLIIGVFFIYSLFPLLPYDIAFNTLDIISSQDFQTWAGVLISLGGVGLRISPLFMVTSKIWDTFAESNPITSMGNIMYTNYNIWLILASLILLLAMVGAIVITMKSRR